jgi:hypothetical protein
MPFRRKAHSKYAPEKQEFTFSTGSRNPLPKPEPAKKKARKKLKLRSPSSPNKTI